MMMETLVEDEWGYGDYFRAIDGYVAMEQTRLMAWTAELHNITDGDELYVQSMASSTTNTGPKQTIVNGSASSVMFSSTMRKFRSGRCPRTHQRDTTRSR